MPFKDFGENRYHVGLQGISKNELSDSFHSRVSVFLT